MDAATGWDFRSAVRGLCDSKYLEVSEESSYDKKEDNVPVEVALAKNLTLKQLQDISWYQKGKG